MVLRLLSSTGCLWHTRYASGAPPGGEGARYTQTSATSARSAAASCRPCCLRAAIIRVRWSRYIRMSRFKTCQDMPSGTLVTGVLAVTGISSGKNHRRIVRKAGRENVWKGTMSIVAMPWVIPHPVHLTRRISIRVSTQAGPLGRLKTTVSPGSGSDSK